VIRDRGWMSEECPMGDVVFVLVTLVCFALLGLLAKGLEKL
jgi:hypothetical protein